MTIPDQDQTFPGAAWERATPQSQSVDAAKLNEAVKFLENCGGANGVKRLVIVRNGRMIWRGDEAETRQPVWSITKAFTSTAHGLLIEDGQCTLDTLAVQYDPALAKYYPKVTLRHLATMTSGIDGAGGSYDCDARGRCDANALVEPLPPFFPPGTKYMYWDEATQHYGYALTQIAGEPLLDLLNRRILSPIGIENIGWAKDATGKVPNWTGGLQISASDLARFGLLFLAQGNWKGRQLLPADWVREATRVQVPPSIPDAHPTSNRKGSGVYGYHWWPNGLKPDGQRLWPDAPPTTYARSGYNNNDLFVVPPWNMVLVRLGLDQGEDEITAGEYNTFLRKIGESLMDATVEGTAFTIPLQWECSAPLIAPARREANPSRAQKDPTVVFHEGRWHVFMTVKLPGRSAIEYCSFQKWEDADASPRTVLPISSSDYYCAPQVFFFTPHRKWYLVYQMGVPGAQKMWVAYSTTTNIADPLSWTRAQPILDGGDNDPRQVGGLDYWIICDAQRAYLFLTSLNGKMWRLWTRLNDFPHGFDHCTLALEAKIFEASHTYKIKGLDQYLTIIEENGRRYYKAYLADRLDGGWSPIADSAEKPFAGWNNIRPAAGVDPWTDNISHGELIRDGYDETLTVDPAHWRLVFQGMWDKDKSGKGYGQFQWRIGMLTPISTETTAD